ncbi:hypothetical protein [Simiduia agarivorans]|uniref:Histidine kinase n=1 Tax=Simiduia agarivorans (strain DSM 21679 / JCM 13881 / BCRC 17597 / SA1) TaxID=1117647 RepID=K4KWP4_SIMAS|nr:hypothetical protein [Simiduia agarivorans]AFU98357.1 histidine kinase [Simiduia agarivorans SA1 = DSM 21679]
MKYTSTVTLMALLLIGCGGGGGGSSTPAPTTAPVSDPAPAPTPAPTATPTPTPTETPTPGYAPDDGLLAQDAETSEQLYVEESFTFIATRKLAVTINLYHSDEQEQRVEVYAVKESADLETDHSLKSGSLIAMGKTDANGTWQSQLEIPAHYSQLLFKTSAMGLENYRFVPLMGGEPEYVHVAFEQE